MVEAVNDRGYAVEHAGRGIVGVPTYTVVGGRGRICQVLKWWKMEDQRESGDVHVDGLPCSVEELCGAASS